MSDEMVQEKAAETVAAAEGGSGSDHISAAVENPHVSSEVASPAVVTEEPAPAQHVAPNATNDTPAPPSTEENSDSVSAAAAPAPESSNDMEEFEQEMQALGVGSQYAQSMRPLLEGDVITGTVMRVDREGVLVDVGAKSEGIIRLNELSRDAVANANPESIVSVGEKIRVFVMEPENQDGNPILSKKRADFEQAWEKVQAAKDSQETLHALVTDRVKGGLVVDLGIRGFVPASHVGSGSLKNNLDKYVGQSLALKVIEVDKERRKVVLSNKLAASEERDAKSAETKSSLTVGQTRHGVVRRLTNYGAFIDLGGIDGLLHISEMSWSRINDPKEVLREGQELDVLVLKMDLENNRVSLGLRQILPDPWAGISEHYKEGDIITGSITRMVPFGAFVQVEGGVEGIIPNAELPRNRANKSGGPLAVGDEIEVKVINLRPEERKMTLSVRALMPPEEAAPREASPPREGSAPREGAAERAPREGTAERKPRRNERERDEREDYTRYAPGRQAEPRYTIGDAIAAQRKERTKRERRSDEFEEDDLANIEEEIMAEPIADNDSSEVEA